MSEILQDLQDKYTKVAKDFQDWCTKNPVPDPSKGDAEWTGEQQESFDKYNTDIGKVVGELESYNQRIASAATRKAALELLHERNREIEGSKQMYSAGGAKEDFIDESPEALKRKARLRKDAFMDQLRDGLRNPEERSRQFCKSRNINEKEYQACANWNPERQPGTLTSDGVEFLNGFDARETRAMVVSDMTLGGAFVPEQQYAEIIRNAVATTALLGKIRHVKVSGPYLPLMRILPPTAAEDIGVYPSQFVGDRWVQEADVKAVHLAPNQDQPVTGKDKIVVHKYKPKPMFASGDLLMDAPAFESEFNRVVNETYGVDMLKNVILGSGQDRPLGILADPDLVGGYVNSGASGAFTYTGLLELIYGLNESWAEDPSVALAIRRAAYGTLLGMQDGAGHFIIPYNAPPMTIHGYPIVTTAFLPIAGAGAKAAIFGAFNQYILVDRMALQIGRLAEIAFPDVWFQPVARYGGQVVNPGAFRIQVLS